MFHEDVGNDRGKGGIHGRAFDFLIKNTIIGKESVSKAIMNKVKGFRVNKLRDKIDGFQNEDLVKRETTLKPTMTLLSLSIRSLIC